MTDQKTVINVKDLHKDFLLPQHKKTSLKELFIGLFRRERKVKQKVLDGISFSIKEGDFCGIVGRNGSGKSTLLKILAGVYTPSAGEISMQGKLTPFIELGVGFNPELSGRDNVYLNGALLGFTHKQMSYMYDEIVDFAELQPYMDQKLKNYSSGMQVRLAFSIAIMAKNDILIFDEVLAVGDEAFQRKCLDVFEKYRAKKQTVILVTHDMDTVRQYCSRAILLKDGKIIEDGSPRTVANAYSKLNQDSVDAETDRANDKKQSALKVFITDERDVKKSSYGVGDTIKVHVDWSEISGKVQSVGVNIFKQSGEHVTGANTLKDELPLSNRINATIEFGLPLQPGKYFVLVEVYEDVGKLLDAQEENAPHFTVKKKDVSWSGIIELPHIWK